MFKIYFRPFWVILVKKFQKMGESHTFSPIFGFQIFLQVFDNSNGRKKCPNNGLVSEKILFIFCYSRGRGRVWPKSNICYTFFVGFPYLADIAHNYTYCWSFCKLSWVRTSIELFLHSWKSYISRKKEYKYCFWRAKCINW